MLGYSGWDLVTTAALLVVVLVPGLSLLWVARASPPISYRFSCPWRARLVTVEVQAGDRGGPACVLSCTAFAEPQAVACGMPCVSGDGREVNG